MSGSVSLALSAVLPVCVWRGGGGVLVCDPVMDLRTVQGLTPTSYLVEGDELMDFEVL